MGYPATIPRVLVIAEACNPIWTSVPLVGYNFAHALASRDDLDVTVATHPRNRSAIESDEISSLARFFYPDNEYIAARVYQLAQRLRGGSGKGWTTNTAFQSLSYLVFEYELFRLVQSQLAKGQFDLIHRITPVTPTVGSPLSAWTDIPMILGPLNGGLPWPAEYPELRQQENEFLVPLRKMYRFLPYYQKTYRRVIAAIAGSQHTAGEIPDFFQGRRILMPENGVDPRRFEIAEDWTPPSGRFQFVSVGRLVPYKGLWLTLEAMGESKILRRCDLLVIGDGPDRQALAEQATRLGLTERVRFAGWMDQHELAQELAASQAFVFPSLREFGGGVVLEAMSSGLPSIVVDYGGPRDLIDSSCGIMLPMKPAEEMVHQLRQAMESLASDPDCCRQYARQAVQRVRSEFTWEAKAATLSRIYHDLLGTKKADTCHHRSNLELATLA